MITFEPPAPAPDGPVTRRIVSIDGDHGADQGGRQRARDPWTLELTEKTYPRVVADVPWVGYPFISGGWVLLALIALGGAGGRRGGRLERPEARPQAPIRTAEAGDPVDGVRRHRLTPV